MQKGLKLIKAKRWAVVVSVAVLALSLAIWGFFGLASSSISTHSVVRYPENAVALECYLLPQEKQYVKVGNEVELMGYKTTVSSIDKMPLSAEELRQRFEQESMGYLTNTIVRGDWMYVVHLDVDQLSDMPFVLGTPIDTVITYERITPIQQLMRGYA